MQHDSSTKFRMFIFFYYCLFVFLTSQVCWSLKHFCFVQVWSRMLVPCVTCGLFSVTSWRDTVLPIQVCPCVCFLYLVLLFCILHLGSVAPWLGSCMRLKMVLHLAASNSSLCRFLLVCWHFILCCRNVLFKMCSCESTRTLLCFWNDMNTNICLVHSCNYNTRILLWVRSDLCKEKENACCLSVKPNARDFCFQIKFHPWIKILISVINRPVKCLVSFFFWSGHTK